ncbi:MULTISPECIES: hypothetical protein [unclassified Fibrobacter]|uniref:hypothetical protein n=1 Tax=unclassified Fibrobacter TaxID=2634177 RepID=UPI00156510CD|nr:MULTISPECIES: hypothetical protein [unclassified Fibrobacter]
MNKLMSFLIPGLLVIVAFALVKTFLVPPDIAVREWFVYLTAGVTVFGVVIPCVIYYLTTPPGIDHK